MESMVKHKERSGTAKTGAKRKLIAHPSMAPPQSSAESPTEVGCCPTSVAIVPTSSADSLGGSIYRRIISCNHGVSWLWQMNGRVLCLSRAPSPASTGGESEGEEKYAGEGRVAKLFIVFGHLNMATK